MLHRAIAIADYHKASFLLSVEAFNTTELLTLISIIFKVVVRILRKPYSVYSWTQGGLDVYMSAVNSTNETIKSIGTKIGNGIGYVGLLISKNRK